MLLLLFLPFYFFVVKHPIKKEKEKTVSKATIIQYGFKNKKVTKQWLEAIQNRESKAYIDSLSKLTTPLTKEELKWKQLIESNIDDWNLMRDSLDIPFGKINIADTITVLLGYRGVDDGFTYKEKTLCIDLTALNNTYGSANKKVNKNRVLRIISHEYTHLLSKKWMKDNNYKIPDNHFKTDSAFKKHVLWEIWYEGFGVYRSMSSKWFPIEGSSSPTAKDALKKLSPVFVEKMITMDTTKVLTLDQKKWIQKNVSEGPFIQKYAALPVGIWLALEANGDDKNLIKWVNKGPEGILGLARKHLKGEYKENFNAIFQNRFDN